MTSNVSSVGYTNSYSREPDGTVPMWVDGRSFMRLPIAESGRSCNTANITALSRVLGNPGWTRYQWVMSNVYQRVTQQTQQVHDVANEAVAEQVNAENTASQLHNKNFHTLNKGEWTKKEKLKLVQINKEERQKGKMFMKRIKQR